MHTQTLGLSRSVFVALAFTLSAFFISTTPAHAGTLTVDSSLTTYLTDINGASGRLITLQNANGSWDWVVTGATGPTANTYYNITGVTAQGLLSAYQATGNNSYLVAAEAAGGYLLTAATSTDSPSTARQNAYNALFLNNLASVTGNAAYSTGASAILSAIFTGTSYWSTTSGNGGSCDPTTGCTVKALIASDEAYRGNTTDGIVPWDIEPYMEALPGTSGKRPVIETMLVSYVNAAAYTGSVPDYALGLASALRASVLMHDTATTTALLARLQAAQNPDGSFGTASDGQVQATAYALVALNVAGDTTNAARAAAYLTSVYSHSGGPTNGWLESDSNEYSEVDAEASNALKQLIPSNTYSSIQSAVNAASSGDTINVGAGTYTGSVTINTPVTLSGAASTTTEIAGQVTINAAGTTISGFDIENPTGNFGVLINAVGSVNISGNYIQNIASSPISQINSYGVYYQSHSTGDISGITVDTNTINNIGAGITGLSNGAIGIGDSLGSGILSSVEIHGNTIATIHGSTKGAYGILVNHGANSGGSTSGLSVMDNSISGLSGGWAHAIGLEGDTPGANIEHNTIRNVSATGIDASALHFESNAGAGTVSVTRNTFDSTSVTFGITNTTASSISASSNYWNNGGTDPSASVGSTGGAILVTPWYTDAALTTLSNIASLTSFTINGVSGSIDGSNNVLVVLPAGTDLTNLTPTIVFVGGSVTPDSGVSHNFSTAQTYTVSSIDGSTNAHYQVAVKHSQTISIDTHAPASASYGSSFGVAAHSDSTLGVAITTSGSCGVTAGGINSATITMTSGTGSCTVHYNQSGDSTTVAASEVTDTTTAQKVALTISGITVPSRTYNGNTSATLDASSAAVVGLVGTDSATVSISGATATFADKNVGTGKAVAISGVTTTADSNNYSLTQPSASGDITPYAIEVTAQTATKTYDGTTNSIVVPSITSGSLQGTDTAGFSETFGTRNVGTGITLTASGVVNDNNGGNNYTYTFVPDNTGSITQRAITAQATAASKTYDGTTSSSAVPGIAGSGLGTGDTPGFVQTYATSTVGTSIVLTPSGVVNDGNGGANYSVTFTPGPVGTITQKALTVTPNAASKTYGDTLAFAGTEFGTSGLVASDTVATVDLASTGATSTAAVGSYTITAANAAGNGLSNYAISYGTGTLTVGPKSLSVTPDTVSKIVGASDPALTYTHGTLGGSDTDSVFSGSLVRAAGENVGAYAITQGTLSAGANYTIAFTPGTFNVSPDPSAATTTVATSTGTGGTVVGNIGGGLATTTSSGSVSVTVDIPAGTNITGSSTWDGTITAPTATTTTLSVSGNSVSVEAAIAVGSTDTDLVFDKAVKLTFAGQAGKRVGWYDHSGTFTEITTTCADNTQATNDTNVATGGSCKIDAGADLVVWTKHFSTFVAYTQTALTSSVAGGSGGGGGGGGPVGLVGTTNAIVPTVSAGSTGGEVLGAEAYQFMHDLSFGSKGQDVVELQNVLIAEGDLAAGLNTGTFGQLTKAAVAKYQKAHGITPAAGYVGAKTRAVLNAGSAQTTAETSGGTKQTLTDAQIAAILNLLGSFGADQGTITNVSHALGK